MVATLVLFTVFCTANCFTIILNPSSKLDIDVFAIGYDPATEFNSVEREDINVGTDLKICEHARYCCPTDFECCNVDKVSASKESVGFISGGSCCKNSRTFPGWPC